MQLTINALSKHFGTTQALKNINFSLHAGSRVGLIGPNGSGKSTLMRAIMGMIHYQGRIELDGSLSTHVQHSIAQRIAYVPQIAPQFSATVNDLFAAVAKVRDIPIENIITLVESLAINMAEIASKPFRSLSGGMKQKLLIALSLASKPSLLILDEPTSSLDAGTRAQFFQLCEQLGNETTVILCSHRLEEIHNIIDHILALEEGELVYNGSSTVFTQRMGACMIELYVNPANDHSACLGQLGFVRSANSWWRLITNQSKKMSVLNRIHAEIGTSLENMIVRDLDLVDE